jgi:hypothetical protein
VVEFRLRKISRRLVQNLIRRAQLANFTFQGVDPILFLRGHTILHATIFLGLLAHPLKVWGAADLGCNGRDRARLCFMQTLMLTRERGPQ